MFADLSGFTTFSEGRSAADVIAMLNTYWQSVVPAIVDREGGLIERFAGDAILVLFNAFGNQPDHAIRAVRAAAAIQEGSKTVSEGHADWPLFRVGVNTGAVVVGNVGAGSHRSFSAIGDTTNVAARLQTLAAPGQVVIGAATRAQLDDRVTVEPLGRSSSRGSRRRSRRSGSWRSPRGEVLAQPEARSSAGCSTRATTRAAMNRAVRTIVPPRVTSETSTTPRLVATSTRRPAREATISNRCTPLPTSTTISTRSPRMQPS